MSRARDFTRLQFDWLRQVQDDTEISHAAFALAFAICDHINAQSLTAWPTQETLANIVRVDPRTVRRLASDLSDRGHLTIQVQRGRHVPNIYRLVIKNRTSVSGYEAEKEDMAVRLSTEETGHLTPENRTSVSEKPDTHVLQNCLRNTPKEHMPVSPAASAAIDGPKISPPILAAIPTQDADLYRRGREILGSNAGGLIRQLVQKQGGSVPLARAAIETAATKHDPREYIGAIIRGRNSPDDLRARGEAW